MTRIVKQKFLEWAYDDQITNTTRGVLAEYIVAKALRINNTKRLEWEPGGVLRTPGASVTNSKVFATYCFGDPWS